MNIKNKLRKNLLSVGSWLTIPSTDIAEIMSSANFDWIVVDMEHGIKSSETAAELIRIISLNNTPALLRPTTINYNQIKIAMDAGAHGVVIPQVKNLDQIKKVYEQINYPSKGRRGMGLVRAQKYGERFKEYYNWQKNNIILVAQIENLESVKNLEDILSSKLVDALMIGPYDLSSSLGSPGNFKSKKYLNIIKDIKKISKKYNTPLGIHVVEPDISEINRKIKEGFRFLSYSVDFRMLINQIKKLKI